MTVTISGTSGVSLADTNSVATGAIQDNAVSFVKLLSTDWTNSKAASGYQKLPSGLIIQWGVTGTVTDGSYATVTFPLAFPTAVFVVHVTNAGTAGGNYGGTSASSITTTTMRVGHYNGAANSNQLYWLAIGN